jgi:hypothetical protein
MRPQSTTQKSAKTAKPQSVCASTSSSIANTMFKPVEGVVGLQNMAQTLEAEGKYTAV